MSHLIGENGKTELPLDELNATFMLLTTAGSETTATVLTGTLYYLVNNPGKLAILVEEVRSKFSGCWTFPWMPPVICHVSTR